MNATHKIRTIDGYESVVLPLVFHIEVSVATLIITSAHGAALYMRLVDKAIAVQQAHLLNIAVDKYWAAVSEAD